MSRLSHVQALLGPELFSKIRETRILVVGAGGIGCELLKNLVLVGFANIEIIDLDTIDLSNLNRQFLFRKPDISKPKALVAAATARHFNPSSGIEIHARHGNVKEDANDVEWIKGFGLVMNALDNMDARRHVNRLCQAANVPLIESGTAGYLGQVTPIIRDETECFDCVPKQTPKSFPVCTIRATPSEPIHCIVWGKSYLFNKVFGEDDEAGDSEELEKAKENGENGKLKNASLPITTLTITSAAEIDNLKKEAAAFREVRKNLGEEEGPRRVFHKVFNEDINRLLAMDDMWKVPGRIRPVPLDYDSIMEGTFVAPPVRGPTPKPGQRTNVIGPTAGKENGDSAVNGKDASGSSGLKDQRELTLRENLELFMDSCRRLAARSIARPDLVLSFDKDDDDTLDFVLATANLRATAYGIACKTRFQVKEMAGNIIPAIATTNAIIAGLIVMQSLGILSKNLKATKNVFLKSDPTKPLGQYPLNKPDENCSVCRDIYIPLKLDVKRCTLGEFVLDIVGKWLKDGLNAHIHGENGDRNGTATGDVEGEEEEEFGCSVYEGARILADPDFDDNFEKTLVELGVERGKMLTVVDEDEKYRPIHFCICELEPNSEVSYVLPASLPNIPRRPKKAPIPSPSPEPEIIEALPSMPSSTVTGVKRSAPDEETEDEAVKKRKTQRVTVVNGDDDDDFEIM